MNLAIVSVGKVPKSTVFHFMDSLKIQPTKILTGGKGGGCWWVENWTKGEIPIERIEPNFKLYKRKATGKAQDKMMFECDALVAFHDKKSRQVSGMIQYALHQKKEVFICYI